MNKNKLLVLVDILVLMLVLPMTVLAVDLQQQITPEDKAKFDEILSPVMKIYNLVKYAATIIAALFLLLSGINYMSSGSDMLKRDKAKNMAGYVIVGLVIIWATPYLVNFFVS